jgi:hypothetical protein
MSTGKYGMGMNTITLDTKLNSTIPRYPSSKPKLKKFSIANKNLTYLQQVYSEV